MALRGIRSTVQRIVIVAGLAVALLVGSVALGPQSDASAAPMHCTLAEWEIRTAFAYLEAGNIAKYNYHTGRASVFAAMC